MLLVGSNRHEHQLDPGQQIPRFGGREISEQERFLSHRSGRVGHQLFSCAHFAARCSAGVILGSQANCTLQNLVFAASERDAEPNSCTNVHLHVAVHQDDTTRAADRVDLSRIDLSDGR
jgi:hypothetical protein